MFFRGRSLRNPDPKGRLMLPPEFRELVCQKHEGGQLVITTNDNCLLGLTMPDWEDLEAKFAALHNPTRKLRDLRRLVLGGAEVMALDPQGRIRLTSEHIKYAGLSKEVLVVGMGPRFEIWSPERFDSVTSQNFDDIAEDIADAGINLGL